MTQWTCPDVGLPRWAVRMLGGSTCKQLYCMLCQKIIKHGCARSSCLKESRRQFSERYLPKLTTMFRQVNRSRAVRDLTEENQYDRLSETVTPLYKQPYEVQLEMKQIHMRSRLSLMVVMAVNSWPKAVCSRIVAQSERHDGQCCHLEEIKPAPMIYGYRNKDEANVGCNIHGNRKTVGLYVGKLKNDNVVCIEPTHLVNISERHKEICKAYQNFIRQSPLPACQIWQDGGNWKDIMLRTNRLGETMALIKFHPQQLSQTEIDSAQNDLADYFKFGPGKSFDLHSLFFQPCPRVFATSEVFPHMLLHGQPVLEETVLGMKFRISPDSFFQTNTLAAEVLYSTVAEYAQITHNSTVLDIYCGTGTIGIFLSKGAKRLIGIEGIESAVEDARFNASLNGCENVQFIAGNAHKLLNELFRSEDFTDDVVAVVNPGRIGMSAKAVRAIRRCSAIRRLVYVTCKPHGKVLKNFVELCIDEHEDKDGEGFVPVKAVAVDMFPHTIHTELVVLFER